MLEHSSSLCLVSTYLPLLVLVLFVKTFWRSRSPRLCLELSFWRWMNEGRRHRPSFFVTGHTRLYLFEPPRGEPRPRPSHRHSGEGRPPRLGPPYADVSAGSGPPSRGSRGGEGGLCGSGWGSGGGRLSRALVSHISRERGRGGTGGRSAASESPAVEEVGS